MSKGVYARRPEMLAKVSATMKRLGIRPPVPTPETRRKAGLSLRGISYSLETRARMSRASKEKWARASFRAIMAAACRRRPSSLEVKVMTLLDAAGVDYVFQFPVPETRYIADFYLPQRNTLIEADGSYWHELRAQTDALRDARLSALGYRVVRLRAKRTKTTPDEEQSWRSVLSL